MAIWTETGATYLTAIQAPGVFGIAFNTPVMITPPDIRIIQVTPFQGNFYTILLGSGDGGGSDPAPVNTQRWSD